jgi:hypothetical protein
VSFQHPVSCSCKPNPPAFLSLSFTWPKSVDRIYASMIAQSGGADDGFWSSLNSADRADLRRYVEAREAELAEQRARLMADRAEEAPLAPTRIESLLFLLVAEVIHRDKIPGGHSWRPAKAILT